MSLSYAVIYDAYRQMYPTWNPGQLHQAVVRDDRWNGKGGPVIDPSPGTIDVSGGTLYTYEQLLAAYTKTYPHFSADQRHQAILVDTRWNGIGGPDRPPPDTEPAPIIEPAPPMTRDEIEPEIVYYTWLELKDAWETMNPDWTQDQVYAAIRKDDRWDQVEPDLTGGDPPDDPVDPVPEPVPDPVPPVDPVEPDPEPPANQVIPKLKQIWRKHQMKVVLLGAAGVGLIIFVTFMRGRK